MNLAALIALQALTILTIAAFIRAIGRRRRAPPLVAPTTPQTTTSHTAPTHRAAGSLQQLLGRARKGIALAGLLLGFAFLPWPTAWATKMKRRTTLKSRARTRTKTTANHHKRKVWLYFGCNEAA
jgi:hypothetical protein